MKIVPCRFKPLIALIGAALTLNACIDGSESLAPRELISSEASRLTVPAIGSYTQLNYGPCGLRDDGVVRCWDDNQTTVEKTATTGRFTFFERSFEHMCGIRSDGAVECWGDNAKGQAPPLVTPPNGISFVDLALGNSYSCALRNDGVIQCWGEDRAGEAPATRVATVGVFVAVEAQADITCGLTNFGVIECFGIRNQTWSASEGTFTKIVSILYLCGMRTGGFVECKPSPNFDEVPMSGSFIAYAMNGDGQCGITVAGVAQCGAPNGEPLTTRTASSGTFTQIVITWRYVCALRSDGGIECWSTTFGGGAFEQVLPTATFTASTSVIVGQPIVLQLSNAQVPGYPAATTFTYAFDCGSGSFMVPGNMSTANCPTSTTGTRVVRGKVVDEDLAESVYSATVVIKNAQQGAEDLVTEVQLAPLSPDIRRALMAKLDAALSAIEKGKTNAACSALKDFINQVNAQKGKAIPIATADAWIVTAQQLQAAIGC